MINITVSQSNKCNGEYSVYLSFPYDEKIINVIRSFPTRYWHPDKKLWELPYHSLEELKQKLFFEKIEITGLSEIVSRETKRINYEYKTKPFSHQIEGFEYGMQYDKWLLGDEQGLGKTKQVIDIAVAKKQQRGYKHCLIICGVNGLKWNWASEIKIHSNEGSWILGQRERKGKLTIGGNSLKLDDLRAISKINEYFIITNIETLRNAQILEIIKGLCERGEINMIAADEVHKMKNPTSQQGKAFLKLQAETMIAMTGTPLMNAPLDLFIILKWLGYEKHSFYQFKNHYCVLGGFGGYQVVGYRNLNELQRQLNDVMLRRLKQDVLDLPEKLRVDEYVEMTPKQQQIYNEVTAHIKAHIDEIKMSNNPLAELIRLRQATGYTGILSSDIKESAKLDRMEELVEDAVSNGKKVVIFSNWTQITHEVFNRLYEYDPMLITGETPDSSRQLRVEMFQDTKHPSKVIIGTIGAMGTGLTLTAGTVEIFMDEPWNMALKEQAEDRCHRVGTKENVTIYTLMCKDTIDERIHAIVERKGAMANAIVDGNVIGNKRELIEYLIG